MIGVGFVRHDLAGAWSGVRGHGGVIDLIGLLLAAMPDLKLESDDMFGAGVLPTLSACCSGGSAGCVGYTRVWDELSHA